MRKHHYLATSKRNAELTLAGLTGNPENSGFKGMAETVNLTSFYLPSCCLLDTCLLPSEDAWFPCCS